MSHLSEVSLSERIISKGNQLATKVVIHEKPLLVALSILVVIGLIAFAAGSAALGGHLNFWHAGALSNLGQIEAIKLMSIGGGVGALLFTGACLMHYCVGVRKAALIEEGSLAPLKLKGEMFLDASYAHENNEGNADLVYCDPKLGFACVVDGVGHDNPEMRQGLLEHFEPFIKIYSEGLKKILEDENPTFEDVQRYFYQKTFDLHNVFKKGDLPTNQRNVSGKEPQMVDGVKVYKDQGTFLDIAYKPAISFVQVVKQFDKMTLLTLQAGDTTVVYEDAKGKLQKTNKSGNDCLGSDAVMRRENFDITGAKRVIGFSDGIGEFVTFKELEESVQASPTNVNLFAHLKKKITSQPVTSEIEEDTGDYRRHGPAIHNETAANGCTLKRFDPNAKECKEGKVDDMSLFVLNILN